MPWAAQRPLLQREKIFLYCLVLGLIPIFGALVENRTVFLERRMGDLDCYLRAAWAIRTGEDPYAVVSENNWHYNYPPLYAILLTPLADPPIGYDDAGYVPYWISVGLCYLANVIFLVIGVHLLAGSIEQTSADPTFRSQPRYCLRWWALRLWPCMVCLLPIGHTLTRGQVNLFVLMLLCAALAGWMRGQNLRAGLWLAFAICIKVIPVYLLVYPLWKRDTRGLLGCGLGLLAGLVVIPVLASGPAQTLTQYETYAKVFFGPLLNLNDDPSRGDEILGNPNATESIGVKNALFNWMYPDTGPRPQDLPALGKAAYLLLGIAMTFLTLWPSSRPRSQTLARQLHPFAGLILLMAIFSPVCHSHYLTFCLPIVMCMLASHWQFQDSVALPRMWTVSFAVFFFTMAVAYLPGLEILKDRCAALFAALPLWGIPAVQWWRGTGHSAPRMDASPVVEAPKAA